MTPGAGAPVTASPISELVALTRAGFPPPGFLSFRAKERPPAAQIWGRAENPVALSPPWGTRQGNRQTSDAIAAFIPRMALWGGAGGRWRETANEKGAAGATPSLQSILSILSPQTARAGVPFASLGAKRTLFAAFSASTLSGLFASKTAHGDACPPAPGGSFAALAAFALFAGQNPLDLRQGKGRQTVRGAVRRLAGRPRPSPLRVNRQSGGGGASDMRHEAWDERHGGGEGGLVSCLASRALRAARWIAPRRGAISQAGHSPAKVASSHGRAWPQFISACSGVAET